MLERERGHALAAAENARAVQAEQTERRQAADARAAAIEAPPGRGTRPARCHPGPRWRPPAVRRADRIDTEDIAKMVGTRGLSWLLEDDALTAVEVLTVRYATGDHLGPWRYQARAMPPAAAVDAALADPEITRPVVETVLEFHREYMIVLRKELALLVGIGKG